MVGTTTTERSTQAWAIESARRRIGMSREDLARHLSRVTDYDWTATMVRNLEIGTKRIDAAWIPKLSDILDAPEWFLLGGWERRRDEITIHGADVQPAVQSGDTARYLRPTRHGDGPRPPMTPLPALAAA